MKNTLTRLLITVLLFSFYHEKAISQLSSDSTAEMTGDLTPPKSLGDTVLNPYTFDKDDSIRDYKMGKDFAYMKYLDSLLRNTKGLTSDTFSIQNASSTRGKRRSGRDTADQSPGQQVNIFSLPFVKIILWILAVFLIGFLVWRLFLGENFFRRRREYKDHQDEAKEEELTDASGYDQLIARAVEDKNYRLAIRYWYLQSLKKLSDNGLVQFSADKTNYQYVSELHGKPYQDDFASITLHYEYVWYGKFEIGEDVYAKLSGGFRSFNRKI